MVAIKQVKISDVDVLRQVAIKTYIDTFAPYNTQENMDAYLLEAYNPDRMKKELEENGSTAWIAWDDDQPAGFARMRNSDEVAQTLGKNAIELQRLYVLPEYKRKKIGSLLMDHIVNHAINGKFEWLWLGVWEKNFNAQSFYANWGFEKFGEHVFQMGDDPQIDWMLAVNLSALVLRQRQSR
jgi:diamine N-acetyltransferase